MSKLFLALITIFLGVSSFYAQSTRPTPAPTPKVDEMEIEIRQANRSNLRFEAMRSTSGRNELSKEDLISKNWKYLKLSDRDKELISIDPEDEAKYSDFLKLSDAGFVRFHDSEQCNESRNIVYSGGSCPSGVTGKATAFSFRKEIYTVSVFSDIQRAADKIRIAGINQLGFIANLGDVELISLDLQSPGIKELAAFEPSTDIKEIQYQHNLARNGFRVGKYVYKAEMPIEVNKTYVLRSIAYDGKAYRTFGDRKINIFDGDERKDVIVIFRVIRKFDDGSYGILWKELRSQDSPTITAGK